MAMATPSQRVLGMKSRRSWRAATIARSRAILVLAAAASAASIATFAGHRVVSSLAFASGRSGTDGWDLRGRAARAKSRLQRPSGSTGEETTDSPLELWLDCRQAKEVFLNGVRIASGGLEETEGVRKIMVNLVKDMKTKFEKVGMTLPKGKFIDAILVNPQDIDAAVQDAKDLGMPVFFHQSKFDGFELPDPNSRFICSAETRLPIGAVPPPMVQFAAHRRPYATEVWQFKWEAELAAAEERAKKEAEEEKRYQEGLEDDSKYVLPSSRRLSQLLGVKYVDENAPLTQGGVFAKALPPDAQLWAREIAKRSMEGGKGKPTYNVGST